MTGIIDDWKYKSHPNIICLFDIDGTLTPARKVMSISCIHEVDHIPRNAWNSLQASRESCSWVCWRFWPSKTSRADRWWWYLNFTSNIVISLVLDVFDYSFAENGLTAYRLGKQLASASFIGYLGEEQYKKLVNFILHYIADLDIPIKRGTFVEFRNGMINVSPIGRNCRYIDSSCLIGTILAIQNEMNLNYSTRLKPKKIDLQI